MSLPAAVRQQTLELAVMPGERDHGNSEAQKYRNGELQRVGGWTSLGPGSHG